MNPSAISADARSKVRILIVEDEPVLAFTLEDFLVEAGFEIAGVAGRLETALAIIEGGNGDVTLSCDGRSGAAAVDI
jgi:DNA-binding response OmpR family regulator